MKTLIMALIALGISARACAQGIEDLNASGPGFIILTSANSTDIWISSSTGNGVNDQRLLVGGSGDFNHALIQMDVSGMPALEAGERFYLRLFCYGNGGGSNVGMYLDAVTSPWNNSTSWATAPSSEFLRQLPAPRTNDFYVIEITDVYQQWKSGARANFGIKLRPVGNSNQYNEFYSVDYANAMYRPKGEIAVAPRRTYPFVKFPLAGGYDPNRIVTDFGQHWQNGYCGTQRLLSTGLDLQAAVGAEVLAAADGTVKLSHQDPKWGGFIVIEHQTLFHGLVTTVYEHVEPMKKDRTAPKPGDTVHRGDVIGKVALGTEVTYPHLRFQLRESSYNALTLVLGLPEAFECTNLPAFPERFVDLRNAVWKD